MAKRQWSEREQRLIQWGLVGLLLLLIGGIHLLDPTFLRHGLAAVADGRFPRDDGVFGLFRRVGDPGQFSDRWDHQHCRLFAASYFSTANGLVFGIVPGIIISWLGETGRRADFLLADADAVSRWWPSTSSKRTGC